MTVLSPRPAHGRGPAERSSQLRIALGQHSDRGRKEVNQDCHGACIPEKSQLSAKGIAVALADGISSSAVSHIASQTAVAGFLADYYCTSDAWSVKQSAQRVLAATNSWLHAQTRQSEYRYDSDRGYVCTFSALIIKSTVAYLFHVGDARIYRLHGATLEQLTTDHRLRLSAHKSYLARAMGVGPQVEIDHLTMAVGEGDVFVLATDGVYEHADAQTICAAVDAYPDDLDRAARHIVEQALAKGSEDNLTVQIVRIEELPVQPAEELTHQLTELPPPSLLETGAEVDGYLVVRELHGSSRSHVYLALDQHSGATVVLKTPSIDQQQDPAYLERFLLEEWIARRINSAHVVQASPPARRRTCLYTVTEFIDGQTLMQWMIDHPKPDLETVRGIVEQVAKGLRAFHRLEMLHQDLRPQNILIDRTGTVKIIDFGSASVAGLREMQPLSGSGPLLGTAQYSAPEYFLGQPGSVRSDIFSLGVITYQLLCGSLPYGTQVAKTTTRAAQNRLKYHNVTEQRRDLPAWVDEVLKKALQPDPNRRYAELSEFTFELRHPSKSLLDKPHSPLIERDPVLFWQGLSLILAMMVLVILMKDLQS